MAAAADRDSGANRQDERFMAAAIRLSRRNLGLTATNPSVGTLIVCDDGAGPTIVGRGITARGGRPHAEAEALLEAGDRARGATAYVTLEPCAHHGRTPPCAEALVRAGVARVVGGASDPDSRVSGRGYAMLRQAGVEVVEGVLAEKAAELMEGYLIRSCSRRPQVTLKLAVSADGMIGRAGEGQVAITGAEARRQVHLMRAESDAILVGVGTAVADDPLLDCRLPGLEDRSPIRIVLDPDLRIPVSSRLVESAGRTPLLLAAQGSADRAKRAELAAQGAGFLAVERVDGAVALPELLEDLAAQGISTLLVEGGAATVRSFLDEGLVDRIVLFEGEMVIGTGGIAAPFSAESLPQGFTLLRDERFGTDRCREFARKI